MSGFILLKVLNIPVNPSKAGYLNSGNSLWHTVSIVMPSYRWVAYYLIAVENGIVIGFYDWQIIFYLPAKQLTLLSESTNSTMKQTIMKESILKRFNVNVCGNGNQPMLFAHGLGCDQEMWRFITPAFEKEYKIVLFDYIGCGKSDSSHYDKENYSSLQGYANDILAISEALALKNIIFVGHSVSAMTGLLAAISSPGFFSKIIMVGPTPCYINDKNYIGGFERKEIEELLEAMGKNFYNWGGSFAPVVMQNPERPQLTKELEDRMCSSDPAITIDFARAAFFADQRNDLNKLKIPSLIMQCSEDILIPLQVGEYMQKNMPQSTLRVMKATGHCPHLSAPAETIQIMKQFLQDGI